jgi:hypothetical protein
MLCVMLRPWFRVGCHACFCRPDGWTPSVLVLCQHDGESMHACDGAGATREAGRPPPRGAGQAGRPRRLPAPCHLSGCRTAPSRDQPVLPSIRSSRPGGTGVGFPGWWSIITIIKSVASVMKELTLLQELSSAFLRVYTHPRGCCVKSLANGNSWAAALCGGRHQHGGHGIACGADVAFQSTQQIQLAVRE